MIGSFAVQLVAGVGAAAQLLVANRVLDQVIESTDGTFADAAPLLVAMVVITTAIGLATVLQATMAMVLAEAVSVRAVGDILDVAAATEPIVWEQPSFHDRLERARFNASARPIMAVNGMLSLLGALIGAAGVAVAIVVIDPLLLPLAAAGAIPAWLTSAGNSRRYHRFTRQTTADDRRRSYLMHALSNRDLAKELRVYGMEGELRRRHDLLHAERLRRIRLLARSRRRASVLSSLAAAAAMSASLAYLFWAVEVGRLDLAAAGTALFSLLFLAQRLRALVAAAGTLYEAGLFLDEVREFSAPTVDAVPAPVEALDRLPAFEHLTARGLTFRYPDAERRAVDGIDLEVRRGEVIALVGQNGSGKSTLAKLLAGIYRPDDGSLDWDGVELLDRAPNVLRRSVAVLFQDYARLQLTAADNVGLGDPHRLGDRAAIQAAGALAGADEVVFGLPDGWDQVLSRMFEGGVDLSGGEWQRIALARALFRDAPFVILDEPSSALDARAEARLFERIRSLVAGRSVLFISHRFATVRLADRIYVLDGGRVVEVGTHTELMAAGRGYAELYRLQAAAFAEHHGDDVGHPDGVGL